MNYSLGEDLKPFEIEIDKYRPYFYAGASGDFNAIHIDNDFAKAVGLPGIILQGLCTMAYVYKAFANNIDPASIKKLKVRFRNIVKPLDRLTIKGKVSKIENDLTTIDIEALNQKNEPVITNACVVLKM